jgi:hypothetical protein
MMADPSALPMFLDDLLIGEGDVLLGLSSCSPNPHTQTQTICGHCECGLYLRVEVGHILMNTVLYRVCLFVLALPVNALTLHDPVPLPPFKRLAFGQPFTVTWTLDGGESGQLLIRAKSMNSEASDWITLASGVKLSDRQLTAKINADSSLFTRYAGFIYNMYQGLLTFSPV